MTEHEKGKDEPHLNALVKAYASFGELGRRNMDKKYPHIDFKKLIAEEKLMQHTDELNLNESETFKAHTTSADNSSFDGNRFCTKCGKFISEGSVFCGGCGTALVSATTEQQNHSSANSIQNTYTTQLKNYNKSNNLETQDMGFWLPAGATGGIVMFSLLDWFTIGGGWLFQENVNLFSAWSYLNEIWSWEVQMFGDATREVVGLWFLFSVLIAVLVLSVTLQIIALTKKYHGIEDRTEYAYWGYMISIAVPVVTFFLVLFLSSF